MQKYFIFGDAHLEAGVEPDSAYKLFKKVVQYLRPDKIINLGDWLDFSYISKFSEGVPGASEGKRLADDIDLLKKEIQFFKKYTKDFVYLSGNHDDRLAKYLEKNPVLKGIFSIDNICKDEGIKYVPTIKQPTPILPDLYATHGVTFAKYASANMVERAGVSCIGGHCHRTATYVHQFVDGRILYGETIGTLGSVNPDYVAGQRVTGHTQSFAILYVDDDIWDMNTILIRNGKCIINGKMYSI